MQTIKIWESNLIDRYQYTDDIDTLLKYIEDNELTTISDREKFVPGDSTQNHFERFCSEQDIELIYLDSEHKIMLPTDTIYGSPCVDKEILDLHKEKIVEKLHRNILKEEYAIDITPYTYSEEYIEQLIMQKPKCHYMFYDVDVSENIKQKLIKNFIRANQIINNNQIPISNNYIIGSITKDAALNAKTIFLKIDDIETIYEDRLSYFNDSATIKFTNEKKLTVADYNKIAYFINCLDKMHKNNIVKIAVENREPFRKSNLFKLKLNSIKLTINNDLYEYPFEQYINEDNRLYNLVKNIVEANLSPLEKYIAVYNIVKNFKEYKENDDDREQARSLRHILDNEYLVCVGFAKLLKELCEKVGISCETIHVDVDTSYDKGFTVEETVTKKGGHARNLVKIDDDKYGIHGIYIADPTWDNDLDKNLLNHALNPIEKVQRGKRMFWSNDTFLILDVHNFEDFNNQVNILLRDSYKKNITNFQNENYKKTLDYTRYKAGNPLSTDIQFKIDKNKECLLKSYQEVVKKIKDSLKCDQDNFDKIYNKYLFKSEEDYIYFLTEIGNYIVSQTNIPFDDSILIDADIAGKTELGTIEQEKTNRDELVKTHLNNDVTKFPYTPSKDNDHISYHYTDENYLNEVQNLTPEMRQIIIDKIQSKINNNIEEEKDNEGKSLR